MSRLAAGVLLACALVAIVALPVRGQVAPTTTLPATESGAETVEGDDGVEDKELSPVDPALLVEAANEGERAAADIRQRIGALAQARLDVALTGSDVAQAALDRASTRLITQVGQLQASGAELDQLQFSHRQVVQAYNDARQTLAQHVAVLYTSNPRAVITNDLLAAGDLDLAIARAHLIRAILDSDRRMLIETYTAAAASDPDVEGRAATLRAETDSLDVLFSAEEVAATIAAAAGAGLKDVETLEDDWVFPVAGDHHFVDSFLAPRMTGTSLAHRHQGADVFAESGTPLLAVERGIVGRVGEVSLGGLRVWLIGESGANYYYAHLSAFADGLAPGQFVEAGVVLGFVGDTGNAGGTAPHVHFQVHPSGGRAVNPYPLLRQVSDIRS